MSSSEDFAPYQSVQLKLAYYLAAAIVAGMVAVPAGMLATRMLASRTAPTATVPVAPRPAEPISIESAPAAAARSDGAPSAAAPMVSAPPASVPAESARSDGAPRVDVPVAVVPPAREPAATMPLPEPLVEAPAETIPELAVAPGLVGSLDPSRLAAERKAFQKQAKTAHAAVRALLERMAKPKFGAQKNARRAARELSGGVNAKRKSRAPALPPVVGPSAMPVPASMTQVARDLDRHGARPVGLGGPAASADGLNGTAIRRRP